MKKKIALICAIIFLISFLVFTVLVMKADVQAIGPKDSKVGLATINGAVADAVGYNETWYNISNYVGYFAILVSAGFALFGLFQVIKRKSLFKVDSHIIILGIFYVAVFGTYILFELFEINYRPILIDGALEASYPSSHTMLSLCIMSTAIFEFHMLLKNRKALIIVADVLCVAIGATVLVGRILSGVHWFSDIIAGILVSGILVCTFFFAALLAKEKSKLKAKNKTLSENTVND